MTRTILIAALAALAAACTAAPPPASTAARPPATPARYIGDVLNETTLSELMCSDETNQTPHCIDWRRHHVE